MRVRKSDEDGIYRSVSSVIVQHTDFRTATKRLQQIYRRSEKAPDPSCLGVFGESRTGKTLLTRGLEGEYPRVRHEDFLEVPVLCVTTPARPTVMGLLESMLQALGDPKFNTGTQCAKLTRLIHLLKVAKTRVVVVDEIQHFIDKRSAIIAYEAADTLKIIVDETKAGLIAAGLARAERVIRENEQLDGRFLSPVRLSRFDWGKETQRKQFVGILVAFHRSINRFVDMPDFGNREMAFRIYVGCGGLIGYVAKFLEQLVWNIGESGKKSVSMNDLRRAYFESVAKDTDANSELQPFHKKFCADPENKEILAIAKQVGKERPPKHLKGNGRAKGRAQAAKAKMSVNEALRAS